MLALVLVLLAGLLNCTASSHQGRTRPFNRDERQVDGLKYLLSINRQRYLDKIGRPGFPEAAQPQKIIEAKPSTTERPRSFFNRPRTSYEERLEQFLAARKDSSQRNDVNLRPQLSKPRDARPQQNKPRDLFRNSLRPTDSRVNSVSQFRGSSTGPRGGFTRNNQRDFNRNSFSSSSNSGQSNVCEDLRLENQMLKAMLARKEEENRRGGERKIESKTGGLAGLLNLVRAQNKDDQPTRPLTALDVIQKLQERNQLNSNPDPYNNAFNLQGGIELQPTTTTVLHTKSYDVTVTQNVTREIAVLFKGRKITTEIVEKELKVSPTSEVVTNTIVITPTYTHHLQNIQPTNLVGQWPLTTPTTPQPAYTPSTPPVTRPTPPIPHPYTSIPTPTIPTPKTYNFSPKTSPRPDALDSFQSLQDILRKIRERAKQVNPGKAESSKASAPAVQQTSQSPSSSPESSSTVEVAPPPSSTVSIQSVKTVPAVQPVPTVQPAVPTVQPGQSEIETVQSTETTAAATAADSTPSTIPSVAPVYAAVTSTIVHVASSVRTAEASVVTLYISGSKPGEFTTSVSTITPQSDSSKESEAARRRRAIRPSAASNAYIPTTSTLHAFNAEDLGSSLVEEEMLLGSFCEPHTVTVTETVTQC